MRVFAGSDDIITPDVVEFARRALDAGVDVKLRFEPGAFHVYVAGAHLSPRLGGHWIIRPSSSSRSGGFKSPGLGAP